MEKIILGLDLASTSTGAAILDGKKLLHKELIQPPKNVTSPLERIAFIEDRINELFEEYSIQYMAVEDVGLNYGMPNLAVCKHNLMLIGGAVAIGNTRKCAVLILAPSEWRKAVGVYAEKVTREEMKREYQKKRGIEKANELFGFDYKWVSDYQDSKDHISDLAESCLIAFAANIIFKDGEV